MKQSTWSSILLFFKTKSIEPYYLVTRPHETAFRYFFYFLIGKHHLFLPIFNFFQDKKHDVHVKRSIFHDCYFCCYDDFCSNVQKFYNFELSFFKFRSYSRLPVRLMARCYVNSFELIIKVQCTHCACIVSKKNSILLELFIF